MYARIARSPSSNAADDAHAGIAAIFSSVNAGGARGFAVLREHELAPRRESRPHQRQLALLGRDRARLSVQ